MFVSKSKYDNLAAQVESLQHKLELYDEYFDRDYRRLRGHDDAIEALSKDVGEPASNTWNSYFLRNLIWGRDGDDQPVGLSLKEKLELLTNYLGLEFKPTPAEVRLVKKAARRGRPAKEGNE